MALGFGFLRLSPQAFWAMTPREFASAVSLFAPGAERLDRAGLTRLMHDFPDQEQFLG